MVKKQEAKETASHMNPLFKGATKPYTVSALPSDRSSTGIRGVNRKKNGYVSRFVYQGRKYFIGHFSTIEEAHKAAHLGVSFGVLFSLDIQ